MVIIVSSGLDSNEHGGFYFDKCLVLLTSCGRKKETKEVGDRLTDG